MRLSGNEKEVVYLEIEKARIEREKAQSVMNKGFALYFLFMVVGVFGFINEYLDSKMLNIIIIAGIVLMVIGAIPYMVFVSREEKLINSLLKKIKK